ncbi:MAG TPA: hypothetical protein VGJ05_02785 [Fimbriiglobus sp.]|jgi:predicted phage terminase large subunit-like protein
MPTSTPSPNASPPAAASHVSQPAVTIHLRRARRDPNEFLGYCLVDSAGAPLEQAAVHTELQAFLSANRHAVVELPRDHGKSTQVCGRIVWELGRNPGLRVTMVSATETTARNRCRYLRELIGTNAHVQRVFPGLVPGEPWGAGAFTIRRPGEAIGPSVTSFGIDAASTGSRCDLLVCDDVVASGSLHSKADRERTISAFQNNLLNQLEPGGRCWCLCTPWHRDDLNARLKANPAFAHFRRAVGANLEPVWPEKWPSGELARRLAEGGEAAFARGFRLLPVAEGETPIRAERVRTWTDRPGGFDDVLLAVDPAVTASPGADASALVVLGRKGRDVYCLESTAHRVLVPDLVDLIDDANRRWAPRKILFETNAAFKGIKDLLARHPGFGVKLDGVVQSTAKAARVGAFAVTVMKGQFFVQAGPGGGIAPGQQALYDEMISFPFGSSDDLVDAAAMGTERLLNEANKSEPRAWVLG